MPFYYGSKLKEGILVEVINDFTMETGISADFLPMARKRQAWALEEDWPTRFLPTRYGCLCRTECTPLGRC